MQRSSVWSKEAQIEAQLSAPTSSPVHADPKNGAKKDVKPTATAEYAENFWNMIRNRGHYGEVPQCPVCG